MFLVIVLLLASPETERFLLGPNPFFRHDGMERAVRDKDIALLGRAAESPYWDARRVAAEGLGRQTPAALLRDPVAAVREAAIRGLGTAAPVADVVRLLEDPDDAVRAAAAWALLGRSRGAPLRALLRDPSPTVRIAALGATGSAARLRALAGRASLADAVPALYALGRCGNAGDAAWLLGRFKKSLAAAGKRRMPLYLREDPGADVALARALGDMARRGVKPAGKTVAEHLRKLVEKSKLEGSTGVLLAEAVAGARDAEGARRILDRQLELRRTSTLPNLYLNPAVYGILHAFSREPWPELAPLLLPFTGSKDPFTRLAVVAAMHGNAVRPALRDPDPRVRAAACARVGSAAPVIAMLRDGSSSVAAAAARALGRLGDPVAGAALEAALGHRDERVRLAVLGAVLRVGSPSRIDALFRRGLREPRAGIRAAVAAVIELLDATDAVLPRAIAELENEDLRTRRSAVALLHLLVEARFDFDATKPAAGRARWQAWLAGRVKRKQAKTQGFRYHVEDLRKRGVDLVLVMDATGSMSAVLQATKRRIETVVDRLRRIVPNLRVRVVAYRDKGDAFVTLGSPLTHDPRILEDFLACIPAAGGGDSPEAVLDGLRNAMSKTAWRRGTQRVVVLFGDAPPHERDRALLKASLQEFKGAVHAVDVGGYGVNAVASGVAMADFQQIAAWGKGAAVRLAGGEDDLLRHLLVLTFGPRWRASVEALFGL
ncbi:MAG: HEAT repeat domain-containing protein [Planctomycetota bacterium]|nr:HEAT repeat domain-containing protein [Planctomycetota bacterium]